MKTIKFLACSLVVASGVMMTSCGDDDSGNNSLPPIGGYNSADEVGAADLVAHWPLDGNGIERISGVGPSNTVATTWVPSTKGQAASFNQGYLNYPVIPSLTNMTGSFTVSLWAKVSNNGTNATMFFQLTKPTSATTNEWNGPMNVMAETGIGSRLVVSDTLKVKGVFNFNKPDGASFGGDAVNAEELNEQDIANGGQVHVNKTAGQWMHVVYTYDGTTAINRLYVNGVKISNPQWEERNKINDVNVGVSYKPFATSHPLIGTFGTILTNNADGWQKSMIGQVDEIRVYKKVLISSDINALYDLEKAGR